jgi:hypothetical protein
MAPAGGLNAEIGTDRLIDARDQNWLINLQKFTKFTVSVVF